MSGYCLRSHPMVGLNLLRAFKQLSVNRWQSLCLFPTICQNKSNFNSKANHMKKMPKEEVIAFDPRFCDTFGALGGYHMKYKRLAAEDLPDDEDNYDSLDIKRGPKMAEIGYKKLLHKYINKKPIQMKKALEVYNKMISEDRIPPDRCTYTLLITGCARVGFTDKAIELFEELLKYEMRPTKPAMTALFNACAECPFPELGLQKARYLRDWMTTNGFVANTLHYHSMIKAFGKLGDMETAYQLVDEMVANGQTTTDETFAMLLMGCISNKESGLYEAIKLLHRMKFHNMCLTIYTFNLLLRAVRDCGIGSEHNLKLLIERSNGPPQESAQSNRNKKCKNMSKSPPMSSNMRETGVSLRDTSDDKSLIVRTPNLLIENSLNEKNVINIDFKSLSTAWNRFMLLGGIEGFIQMMTAFNVKPNINTLTLMTELIDFREESEDVILKLVEKFGVKTDTDFFNILMKHVCRRRGMIGAKRVIEKMSEKGLQPDILTFGVLSLGCNDMSLGKQLLSDMEEMNIKPNIQIIGGLMTNACKANNFLYINFLIHYMKDNDIKPDQKLVESLELIKLKFQKILSDYDWNNTEMNQRFKSEKFRKQFSLFKDNYENCMKRMTLQDKQHPWHQFQIQEIPNKKGMHSFVKFMKHKIQRRRGMGDESELDEYEEDELYNE